MKQSPTLSKSNDPKREKRGGHNYMSQDTDLLWLVKETQFDSQKLGKYESILALGNGYMGIRSATEEHYVGEKRDTFVNGTFDQFDDTEVTELPNVPDVFRLRLWVGGYPLDLNTGQLSHYQRTLNLQTGELTREFRWEIGEYAFQFASSRFISFADRHVLGTKIVITNLGKKPLPIVFESGIDGQQTNSGSQHFSDGEKRLYKGKTLQYVTETNQSHILVSITANQDFSVGDHSTIEQTRTLMPRRQLLREYTVSLSPSEDLVFEKNAAIYSSRDNDVVYPDQNSLQQAGLKRVDELVHDGYVSNLHQSAEAWRKKVWGKMPITIDSNDFMDQLSLNFARYHLHVMTPAHDARMNIGAKGLTGEGYKGHTFWDTELFILPYFIFNYPDIARKLVTYRYHGLAGARRKAAENGYRGAQYPWESAWIEDGESTPIWGPADIITGTPMKIWSGFIEQHITSDVAYGINEYLNATQDNLFGRTYGYEVIFDTARFWTSRMNRSENRQQYDINDVIGPDEYKEHVNNNAFTNYMAYWNMQLAQKLIARLKNEKPEIYRQFDRKMNLQQLAIDLADCLAHLYLPQPNAEQIIPQDDTYLSKKVIDLTPFRNAGKVDEIFDHYNLSQINDMQITKQADVILLLYLFEKSFSSETKRANWDYYEPKTTHDSSLSRLTHSIFAADLGLQDEAWRFYEQARQIDLDNNTNSSNDGVHAAALAGIWNMVIFGFGGIRYLDGTLRITPNLPRKWRSLDFRIWWHQQQLHIHETHDRLEIENLTQTHPVKFTCRENEYELSDRLVISMD
jgi:hypothetical glycosyl hydrolase